MVELYYVMTILTFLGMCGAAYLAARWKDGFAILCGALFILFCVEVVGVWNLANFDVCKGQPHITNGLC